MVCVAKGDANLVAASSQSVSAGVRVWRGRRRGQGDCGGQVHRVVHGQHQPGAPDGHIVFCRGQIVVHSLVEGATPGAGGALTVDGVRAAGVRADGDVRVHGAHAGVVQDEVGIVVVELTFILRRKDRQKHVNKSKRLPGNYSHDGY